MQILAPPDVGVTVDLLDKDAYKAEDDGMYSCIHTQLTDVAPLHPKDEALCRPVDLRKPESRESVDTAKTLLLMPYAGRSWTSVALVGSVKLNILVQRIVLWCVADVELFVGHVV